MEITAKIKSIKYSPTLALDMLKEYDISDIDKALAGESVFMLSVNADNKVAVSRWVSAKRTRSYPYERVYNTLNYSGKCVTVIPIFKDEGLDGDRDFLQWDTVSLMSLLGVYVIIAYYNRAEKNARAKNKNKHKITNQRFDTDYIAAQLETLMSYHSDALHWNMEQINNVGNLFEEAIKEYRKISERTGVALHSEKGARRRIENLKTDKNAFMNYSRILSSNAQKRESVTLHINESVNIGEKATVTISNYLGGNYYFTADEARIVGDDLYIAEAKHSTRGRIPALSDIKDGLLKMFLFCNLEDVTIGGEKYNVRPVLKMTSAKGGKLSKKEEELLTKLRDEAIINNFTVDFRGDMGTK